MAVSVQFTDGIEQLGDRVAMTTKFIQLLSQSIPATAHNRLSESAEMPFRIQYNATLSKRGPLPAAVISSTMRTLAHSFDALFASHKHAEATYTNLVYEDYESAAEVQVRVTITCDTAFIDR